MLWFQVETSESEGSDSFIVNDDASEEESSDDDVARKKKSTRTKAGSFVL